MDCMIFDDIILLKSIIKIFLMVKMLAPNFSHGGEKQPKTFEILACTFVKTKEFFPKD